MLDNYVKLRPGHYFQMFRTGPGPSYNNDYISYYNRIPGIAMSKLRYNRIKSVIGNFSSVCDFGYGNGDFLSYCTEQNHSCFGYDISKYPTPPGVQFVNSIDDVSVDLFTFFDSIEHIHNSDLVSFLLGIHTKYFCISLPHMHEEMGAEWFKTWKHRKPNEHFHHFDIHGLTKLLEDAGCDVLYVGNDEDEIRKPVDSLTNILTVIAKKL